MPTYDYRCNACKHAFELFQSIKDGPKRTCPSCGKRALERLIGTGAAVMFKGSGFYQTDYRSDNYKKGAEADSKASSGGGDGGSKNDSKTEAAKPAAPETAAKTKKDGAEPKSKPDKPKGSKKNAAS